MKLVLLGTGGYYPTGKRHTACVLLPEAGIVLDAGSGMCQLGEFLQTRRLDIFLSHAHLDHVQGLTYLINVLPTDVARATVVYGERQKLEAVREHLFAPAIFPVEPPFRFAPLEDSANLTVAGGSVTHFPLAHPGGAIGFRIDWPGHSLAYVTDTTAAKDADYVDYIRGVDLLLHESYFAENERDLPATTGHSWLAPVAEVAAAAEVRRLVLVHIGPHYATDSAFQLEKAKRIFPNLELGMDGVQLNF